MGRRWPRPTLILTPALIYYGDEHTRRRGWEAAAVLLAQAKPPTAIFAASDMLALGTLEYARHKGIHIPDDLSVVGFDDLELASFADLTTIRQPMQQLGNQAAQMVLDLMGGKSLEQRHYQLPLELVVRGSCAVRHTQNA